MQVFNINRKETGLFSEHQSRLVYDQESIQSYIHEPFSKDAIAEQIKLKAEQVSSENRQALVNALVDQYGGLISSPTRENIESLRESNAFTITTGHQLTLLAGPLYFVIKIIQVIKLAEELNEAYPEKNFVPVYWMASEDHDYEEIQSTSLFNKSLSHDYKQRGPVGRFELDNFGEFKEEIRDFFGEDRRTEVDALLASYSGKNLGEATRGLVNQLFSSYGLVIVDGDDHALKSMLAPLMKDELINRSSEKLVQSTDARLAEDGLKVQIHARPINLFHIEKGSRERIQFEDDKYSAGDMSWTEEEILKELEIKPENFSPNVVLRPVYQELILPNLAYIGGGGEISYWLQLRSTFEHYGVQYPLIQVRNSMLWIEKSVVKKLEKVELSWKDVFTDRDRLKKKYLETHASEELDFDNLDRIKTELASEISSKVKSVNPNLEQFANAEIARLNKQLDGLKAKLLKDAKGKHDQAMKSIDFIKDRLFPNGGLQERSSNLLSFCADGRVNERIADIYNAIEPFGKDMIVLFENE
ncbi:MAG: bacillithiol biosynthesis cysteine-adding enzyme BshC [Crocinitomicaceae bacterium]|nr:bacillithiol biosynthesis cysteine-adding enzyme BshC [Crocinitomicaceae bacterium]MDG2440639.1 bacillithiol biosynthesis cysteine-adding enzyme BshC [Crocinitomicaceae bacterium]